MALPILDGNQSATTLSTILSSGQHIPAHTVVSLGTQAITDMRSAVSGSVVSISNFPATQPVSIASVTIGNTVTIAGTVTANPTGTQTIAGTVTANNINLNRLVQDGESQNTFGVPIIYATIAGGDLDYWKEVSQVSGLPVKNEVTGGGDVRPFTISGTVTANTFAVQGTAVTTSNFTSTTASTLLAGYNATREVLTIFNEGAGNLHLCVGATCTTIAYQVRLSAGDYYEVPNHQTTITHSAVFATAGTARVTQVS